MLGFEVTIELSYLIFLLLVIVVIGPMYKKGIIFLFESYLVPWGNLLIIIGDLISRKISSSSKFWLILGLIEDKYKGSFTFERTKVRFFGDFTVTYGSSYYIFLINLKKCIIIYWVKMLFSENYMTIHDDNEIFSSKARVII